MMWEGGRREGIINRSGGGGGEEDLPRVRRRSTAGHCRSLTGRSRMEPSGRIAWLLA